ECFQSELTLEPGENANAIGNSSPFSPLLSGLKRMTPSLCILCIGQGLTPRGCCGPPLFQEFCHCVIEELSSAAETTTLPPPLDRHHDAFSVSQAKRSYRHDINHHVMSKSVPQHSFPSPGSYTPPVFSSMFPELCEERGPV
ncbi:hypothetical protein STEG23_015086, partial [Scotinomys teguina]